MLRILHSRSVVEADTEVVAVVVPMEEAEAASTVAVVVAAGSTEVVVSIAAGRPVARPEAWVHMDAGAECMAAGVRMAHMAERVRTA